MRNNNNKDQSYIEKIKSQFTAFRRVLPAYVLLMALKTQDWIKQSLKFIASKISSLFKVCKKFINQPFAWSTKQNRKGTTMIEENLDGSKRGVQSTMISSSMMSPNNGHNRTSLHTTSAASKSSITSQVTPYSPQ